MTQRSIPRLLLAGLALVLAAACASSGSARGDRNHITASELRESGATDVYTAVQRLRPHWLVKREVQSMRGELELVVVQGNSVLGGPEVLRSRSIEDVTWIEFLDGSRATSHLRGRGLLAGAIVLHTEPEDS